MRYRWLDAQGAVISAHCDLSSAGRAHRRYCRSDIRCIAVGTGLDVTEAAIIASIEW